MSKSLQTALGTLHAVIPQSAISLTPVSAQDRNRFVIISGQSLTNTGPTTIVGNIALSPGTS
jgi:hypothetical protein